MLAVGLNLCAIMTALIVVHGSLVVCTKSKYGACSCVVHHSICTTNATSTVLSEKLKHCVGYHCNSVFVLCMR